jgi:heat shock protein HspQ
MAKARTAKFQIGQIVRHRIYPFRGVIFDIDPEFANTDEWYESIPEDRRPRKDQPFYHLFAENAESEYIAYVSEQNLLPDESGEPVRHPQVAAYKPDAARPYCAFFWNSSKRLRCISSNCFGSVAGPSYTLAKFSSGSTSETT